MKSEFPFLSAGGVETEEIGGGNGSLVGNVNGWRGWAIGHGDAVSPPLSRLYLTNHLSAVMGPVQLSELSQELKPAPARPADSSGHTGLQPAKPGGRGDSRPGWGPREPRCPPTIEAITVNVGSPSVLQENVWFGQSRGWACCTGGEIEAGSQLRVPGVRGPPELCQAHEMRRCGVKARQVGRGWECHALLPGGPFLGPFSSPKPQEQEMSVTKTAGRGHPCGLCPCRS